VFEVYPGLPGEDRYRRLIEEHGKPVPPDTLAKHDRQRQRDVESYASKISTSGARQKETQQREKERQRYRAAIDDLFRIYDIRLVRRESLEGHETIVATLMPNARVKAQTDDGNMMRHFKARAWVSESDYELVRVEIEAIDDLSIGWGLFARVHKGTVAAYQRRKVNNEAWLPAQVTFTASARVLLLKSLRLRGVSEYSGYRKFTVDTSSTYLSPEP
jgi:DNA-binding TFAR19-related protein (PDSD5 family)